MIHRFAICSMCSHSEPVLTLSWESPPRRCHSEPVTEVTGVRISRMNDSMKRILQNRKRRETKTMEKLLEILEDIQPDVDFKTRTDLIDAHLLSSLSILSLIAELEDEFDITVPAVEVIPANFNSMQAMWDMIRRLQEEG